MSLACFECQMGGSFNTLIIFDPDGVFDESHATSSFANFYTDCASAHDFAETVSSRFAIVTLHSSEGSFLTGTDGPTLGQVTWKRISEAEAQARLPRIFKGLVGSKAA